MATANPYFDLQQQALRSLKQIQRVSFGLQALQIVASALVIVLGYVTRTSGIPLGLHTYAAMFYILIAFFAHIVIYYVFAALGKNIRRAQHANALSVSPDLVIRASRLTKQFIPFFVPHLILLFALVGLIFFGNPPSLNLHRALAWVCAAVGLLCGIRVASLLKKSTIYLTAFLDEGLRSRQFHTIKE